MPRRQNGKKDLIKFFLETQILFPSPNHITRSPCVWASLLPCKQSVFVLSFLLHWAFSFSLTGRYLRAVVGMLSVGRRSPEAAWRRQDGVGQTEGRICPSLFQQGHSPWETSELPLGDDYRKIHFIDIFLSRSSHRLPFQWALETHMISHTPVCPLADRYHSEAR